MLFQVIDSNVVLATFWTVLLAGLGDRRSAPSSRSAPQARAACRCFIGASTALVPSTISAVALAGVVSTRLSPRWTQGLAGALPLVMGGNLVGALRPPAAA